MDAGIDAAGGFLYVLVILDDVGRYAWLPPSRGCKANGTVEGLMRWYGTFGPPTTRVSDNVTHCRNRVVASWRKH